MLFVILSGLSLDYHILVVSRIREFAAAGYSTQDAIREGITRTAGGYHECCCYYDRSILRLRWTFLH